ncbi:hypothetical protein FocnCong_v006319 [Fusarium oxysporum f. sp. conglutinans]|nr:hypothetical protein FocnCong_v006319 [Fusarium oxysporum f. sp. conglutinans]
MQVVVKHMASHHDLIRTEVRIEEICRADELRNRELQHFVQTEENNIAQEHASHRAHISAKSYDADLYRFSEAVCKGTGKWLFRDLSFQNWLAGKEKEKPILWLRGIPGAGRDIVMIPFKRTSLTDWLIRQDTTGKQRDQAHSAITGYSDGLRISHLP